MLLLPSVLCFEACQCQAFSQFRSGLCSCHGYPGFGSAGAIMPCHRWCCYAMPPVVFRHGCCPKFAVWNPDAGATWCYQVPGCGLKSSCECLHMLGICLHFFSAFLSLFSAFLFFLSCLFVLLYVALPLFQIPVVFSFHDHMSMMSNSLSFSCSLCHCPSLSLSPVHFLPLLAWIHVKVLYVLPEPGHARTSRNMHTDRRHPHI